MAIISTRFFALALTFGAVQTMYDSRYQELNAKNAFLRFINNSCNIMGGIVFINKFVEVLTTNQ